MGLSKYHRPFDISRLGFFTLLTISLGLVSLNDAFAVPPALTFQGRIVNANGHPLEYGNVSFLFQIMSPSGSCLIYQEQVTGYNMVNSGGLYDVPIGNGSVQYPLGATSVLNVFSNLDTYSCGSCTLSGTAYSCTTSTGTYTPVVGDGRRLRVSFYDGTGWSTITPDNVIRSVPYAGHALAADKLGSNVASDFLLKAGLPSCGANTFLTWSGSALTCAGVSGTASVTVTAPITNSGTVSAPNLGINQATTSASGYLSSADWNTFNGKLGSSLTSANIWVGNGSNVATSVAPSGDVTMSNVGAFTVTKLNGTSVSSTAPSAGQFLKYVSSAWTPTALGIADIKSSISPFNGAFASAACTASQSLYYASGTDDFRCQAVTASAASLSGTIPVSNLPTTTTTGVYVNGGNSFGAAGKIGTKDANSLTLMTQNSDRLTIDTSGKVGIGTTSPTALLEVQGTLIDTSGYSRINFFYGVSNPSSASTAAFTGATGSIAKFDNPNMSGATLVGFTGTAEQGGTGTLGVATGVEAFVTKYGLGNITTVNGVYSHFDGSNTGTTSSFSGVRVGMNLSSGTVTNAYGVYLEGLHGTNSYGVYQAGGSDANYFAGKVGIGTSSPSYNLHVVGTAGLSTGTAWTNASDIRLKDIRGDYEYGLNEILQLHTVRYNYKKNNPLQLPSNFEKTGFIAQEVQKVIPDAVTERSDGFLELNVDPIHWAVVNAIQDFYRKWLSDSQSLHSDVVDLKNENEKLRARLEHLEKVQRCSQK